MTTPAATPLLEMREIVKSFGTEVRALKGVNFRVESGEVCILLGENGAGKSTLLKILTGLYQPDPGGTILLGGQSVILDSPRKSQSLGIRMVYQELNLAPHLTVAQNMFLGNEPKGSAPGLVSHRTESARARAILEQHGFRIDPDAIVENLSAAQRQMVEIAKALAADARLLLLDEPTSSLGEKEIEELFATLRGLKERGLGIVYVSHRLNECFEIGDRIVILRDGEKVYESSIPETDTATVVRAMVGRDLSDFYPKVDAPLGDIRLDVRNFAAPPNLHNATFRARTGEVIGIAGLMGSGRSSLLSALFGLRPATGDVAVDGRPLLLGKGPKRSIDAGLGLLTEDRKKTGLALGLPVRHNVTLAAIPKILAGPFLTDARDRALAKPIVERLGVKTPSVETLVGNLSGGNQQKVVLGRWILADSTVLLFDEPTRGVDVGSKVEIYRRINEATARGATVLMVSSELPELLGMCDRILVLHKGDLVADVPRAEATQERILHYAMTGKDLEITHLTAANAAESTPTGREPA